MASLVYNSFVEDLNEGNVVPAVDTFRLMLVTSAYTPNKDTHTRRSDVTNEVVGPGYAAGGEIVTITVVPDLVNDLTTLTLSNPSWAASTITARAGVIYKARGGLASADELVGYGDFGADVSSSGTTFTATFNSGIVFSNTG